MNIASIALPAATGCPFHNGAIDETLADRARSFDPFEAAYQLDPTEALRWSRDQLPIFFSEKLGYWVVTRYEDIKAVFRDNILYSPRNVLEKITQVTDEAMVVLKTYGYAMNRTMVNEDEPAHMKRRRALMEHFLPERLQSQQPMIRRLTREKIDGFIDAGRVDLVAAMLYEIPLLVALHFLGVPEDEIATLRTFSLAHSINTWGKPTPDQQLAIAHDVGKFWQYAGKVIEKMRADPDGQGWMHFTIQKNSEIPEIVTDNYVHSMMMAIIVAAHETTSLASANMFKTLLSHPTAWQDLCADPSLIPNAVEESLRYAGSIVAWRRETTANAMLGGIALPPGAKLLIVQSSGNRDASHFEAPDHFDIYRDNAADHLTFGYGAHQCMGKNIARMEMRIFLEEITRRMPHLRLASQEFTYVPSLSFRGPEHLWVEWDPAQNPERFTTSLPKASRDFSVGAPLAKDVNRKIRITEIFKEAENILGFKFEDVQGRGLPTWSAGAHVELCHGGYERKYSLCGKAGDAYQIAILREDEGKGGSRYFHETLRQGTELLMRGPRNHFHLNETAPYYLLIAGGIGITPVLAMADRLKTLGRAYHLHYAGHSTDSMAFLERLEAEHSQTLSLYARDKGQRMNLAALVTALPEGSQIYSCGPERMIEELDRLSATLPEGTLHFEAFTGGKTLLDPAKEHEFEIELADSGLTIHVPADQTVLEALHKAGIDLACDCREGLCGSCEASVLSGMVDHRDSVLTSAEKTAMNRMMTCCSRARLGENLKLAL